MVDAVSIVMPAFNEEMSVRATINEMRGLLTAAGVSAEFIVVDDGSRDDTARQAKAAGARVIQHRSNRGYGASLKTGIVEASYDNIRFMMPRQHTGFTFRKCLKVDSRRNGGGRRWANVKIP